jgi:putative OPT family oligopeptide transporter
VIWSIITPLVGCRKMTILETNCMASTASAAGYSTGSTIATMFGALVLLTVVPEGKTAEDIKTWNIHPAWLVAAFTLATGLMGVFLAIPMKRQMINHEQLPFPSGIAAAETLKSLYSESKEALQKAYVLIVGLGIGAIVAVLRTGQGTFQFLDKFYQTTKLEIPQHLPHEGFTKINDRQIMGYSVDTSVLLIAAGMIVGLRVSLSMLLGSVILYMWLGPQLVAMDDANAGKEGYIASIETIAKGTMYHFPRWGLWGGTALMVMASLTALAFQWKTIVRAFAKTDAQAGSASAATEAEMKKVEVPFIWMVIGMVPITIAMIIIQMVAFSISWWAGLIAVAMSFVLSLVASRATGETDTTPIGAMGKVMQLLFAVLKPGQVVPNLASAGIAANSASSSADLLTDLKIGYLLGANPRRQFLAQFWGVFFGTLAIVPIWYLMVPTKAALEKLPAPATQTWAKVAEVLTKGLDFLPDSAKVAILVGAGVGVLLPLIEKFLVPDKYRKFMPSATGLGLSFMLPFYNSLAFTIGAIIAFVWSKADKRSSNLYNVPLASGLVAGESLIAALIAMLATASGLLGWNL